MRVRICNTTSLDPATRCDKMVHFPAISITDHHRTAQVSPEKSQQCGQSATHDGMCQPSPAMLIAAMEIRNI